METNLSSEKNKVLSYFSAFASSYCFFQSVESFDKNTYKDNLTKWFKDEDKKSLDSLEVYLSSANEVWSAHSILFGKDHLLKTLIRMNLKESLISFKASLLKVSINLASESGCLISEADDTLPILVSEPNKDSLYSLASCNLLFANEIYETAKKMQRLKQEIDLFTVPCNQFWTVDEAFNERFQKELSFNSLNGESLFFLEENDCIRKMGFFLSGLLDKLERYFNWMTSSMKREALKEVQMLILKKQEVIKDISDTEFEWGQENYSLNITKYEWFLEKLSVLDGFFKQLRNLSFDFFELPIESPKNILPLALYEKAFSQYLLKKGYLATVSLDSSRLLMEYCEKKGVLPWDLVDAELAKVTPLLEPSVLSFFKLSTNSIFDDKNHGNRQKEMVMKRSESLAKKVLNSSTFILLVMFLPLVFVGCGVKTAPRADLDSLRPSIPFKTKKMDKKIEEGIKK